MFNRKFVLTACIAAVASVLMVASTHARGAIHISHVKFSKAVALPGVVFTIEQWYCLLHCSHWSCAPFAPMAGRCARLGLMRVSAARG